MLQDQTHLELLQIVEPLETLQAQDNREAQIMLLSITGQAEILMPEELRIIQMLVSLVMQIPYLEAVMLKEIR